METKLDDILGSEPAAEPVVDTPATEPIVDEPSGILRDEKGRFAPKETGVEEAPAVEPAPVASEAPPAPPSDQLPPQEFAALKDERRKRQALEDEVARMRAEFAQLRSQPQQPQQPPVDFWEDPQSFMDQRMNQLGQTLLQQWEQRETARRFDASEKAARARHADYDDAYQAFEQAVQANPRLAYELAQADDPGEFAYAKGKTALAIQTVGSVDDLKAQLRAEIEAELKASAPTLRPVLPSTTAADGSVGARSGPEWSGPTPLTGILSK